MRSASAVRHSVPRRNSNAPEISAQEKKEKIQRTIRNLHSALACVQHHQKAETENKKEDTVLRLKTEALKMEGLLIDKGSNNTEDRRFKLGFRRLQVLEQRDSTEILLNLEAPQSGFVELLNSDTFKPEMMELILRILSKVCAAKELSILASLINKTLLESQFLQKHLQQYIIRLQSAGGFSVEDSFKCVIEFLSKFQEIQPVTASEFLTSIIPLLEKSLEKLKNRTVFVSPHIYKKIEELRVTIETTMEKYDVKTRQRIAKSEQVHSEKPPEDYRNIPILPSKEDFANKRPFLRPNIVNGRYMDAAHYLDVQFRLLREDYIRPLRECIETFKTSSIKDQTKRISVYRNVQVLCPFNTEVGVVHLISFDSKPFVNVHWEVSKRFMLGSLLCLSSDGFERMLFATVAKREPSELKEGRLEVHFEEMVDEIFSISPFTSFVMVESEAYFEAFRHTLASLQKMDEDILPMKNYIIDVKKSVDAPKYLRKDSMYDFCSTFHTLKVALAETVKYPLLKPDVWPSNEDLELDSFQYSALQAALTKEFTVIQGPPGTGKTYIGLKIAQMLLENSSVWKQSDHSSILVVCYTNHALDQFLEGILKFTKRVARVGGRSSNETIKEYQLRELRKAARKDGLIPECVHTSRISIVHKVNLIKESINNYTELLENSTWGILSLPFLLSFMSRRHSRFFLPSVNSYRGCSINEWLCTHMAWNEQIEDDDLNSTVAENDVITENEKDIEFELSLKEIDDNEYTLVNSSSKMWKISRKKQWQQKLYIRKQLMSWEKMTAEDARRIRNLQNLELPDRWRLYRFWLEQYIINLHEIITKLQKTYHQECEKLHELRKIEDKILLREAEVIGMTTTGASKYHEYLQEVQPQIVIVEEAAEVLEAHIVTSLTAKTQHLILIGDHQQLKPSPTVYELAVKYSLDISLFERIVNNGMPCFKLVKQHRMRPSIAKLLTPHIYCNLENHPSVEAYDNISGLKNNMFFINHCCQESDIADTRSHSNLYEANFLIHLCRHLMLQGYSSSRITVLTTYSGQLSTIRQLMKGQKLLEGIHVTVVDNFQGKENDIILISFVRSNDEGSIGFLKVSNRVCVALSRAKKGLYCIGNFELFAEESKLWKNIVDSLVKQNAIGTSLALCCQNHPQTINKVTTPEDFAKYAGDGGCTLPCNFMLPCGHVCSRLCHPDDQFHREVKCTKKCENILCDFNHKCPRLCYEKCGECIVLVDKKMPTCEHTALVPCYLDPENFQCPAICNKSLNCGHTCKKQFHQQCEPCTHKVKYSFHCDHYILISCHKFPPVTCPKPCNRKLSCGHTCGSECGIVPCPPCEHSVRTELPCSHETETKCCELKNNNETMCEEGCGKPMSCSHECQSDCGHEGNCGPCTKPCKSILCCSHRCVLECHKICPDMCEICMSTLEKLNYWMTHMKFYYDDPLCDIPDEDGWD